MKRCTTCVMPESFPGITFDSEGTCSLCAAARGKRELIPSRAELTAKLEEIIAQSKAKQRPYDALVAFSGGKDSTFLVHTLKERYGLRILAFTLDNGFMSEQSFVNMRSVLGALDVDHVVLRPRAELLRRIFRESALDGIYPDHLLKYGSSICISCIRMVSSLSLKIALEKKIPMVMLGHSPGQIIQSENEIIYRDNRIPYELRRRLFRPLADRVGEEVYRYLMLEREEYRDPDFPYTINMFPLTGYDEGEIYATISRLGWRRPEDVDPNSSNCRLNALGIVRHQERHGFHPYDHEMSQLVRLGVIGREKALERVEDPAARTQAVARAIEKELFA